MLGNVRITPEWSHYGKQFGSSIAQTKLETLFGERVKTSSQLKTKLKDRKFPVEVECDLCEGVETAGHTLWHCDFATAI